MNSALKISLTNCMNDIIIELENVLTKSPNKQTLIKDLKQAKEALRNLNESIETDYIFENYEILI